MAAPTADMIECKAIILFYEDELGNLEWIAENDANGIRAAGDYIGREMDRWEKHPEHVKDRFRSRARVTLEAVAAADACLSNAEQKAQACGCKGSDDMCPCQNVADRETIAARMAARTESGATTDHLLSDPSRSVTTSQYAGGEADKAPALHSDEHMGELIVQQGLWTAGRGADAEIAAVAEHPCPICAQPFKGGDLCATDIELGMCHAACLEGSPVVDLDSGEPTDGPVTTYPYEVDHHGR